MSELIDELTYVSYSHNRKLSPEVSPERWIKVFGPSAEAMERRYKNELSYKAALGGFPDVNTQQAYYAGCE